MSYGDLLSEDELRALEEIMRVPSAPPSVLLVDDDEVARDALADELVAQGIPCITAESGEQALALLVTRPTIGLLITELHMQCGSGLELVRQVRQSAQPSLPVIIISGDADVQDAIEAMHMRVVDFLLKPVDTSRLVNLARNELGTPPAPKAPPARVRPRPEKPKAKAKVVTLKSA
ncbi:response regulator [Metapseudomonas furukawaii]|jgi:DNA-binding NtrC family response regulator|uniref:Response regulator receiver modulated diguanylate cyclase n=1 Tax=Metapseudomonas furukawaii TaxID=1149133 RepID=A0AAD1BVM1_METFU|nr:response regulator [Pseudomonas furukawaii]OWJ98088.1 response regulator [Pseudomonas sp. A46]BAU72110.1 response regulator receiver modulated diguanylate cyclase [Pseudomonas furukawaii]